MNEFPDNLLEALKKGEVVLISTNSGWSFVCSPEVASKISIQGNPNAKMINHETP